MKPSLLRLLAAGSALALIAACASDPASTPKRTSEPATQVSEPEVNETFPEGFDLGTLPAQALKPGECGLFLFAARPTPRFVFFTNSTDSTAIMRLNGEMVTLARTDVGGEVFDQQYSEQAFVAPAYDVSLNLTLRPGDPTNGGTQIDGGAIRLARSNGWSMVVPVAGATACDAR